MDDCCADETDGDNKQEDGETNACAGHCARSRQGSHGSKEDGGSRCSPGIRKLDVSSKDPCCTGPGRCGGNELSALRIQERNVGSDLDVERGASVLEHVALEVHGLTYVGCKTKLFKALRDIPGIHNFHTSLILSRAEVDLDEKARSGR